MILVIATLKLKPGAAVALEIPIADVIATTRAEVGCIAYDLHRSLSDPDLFVFVEKWRSRADLTAHSKQAHLARWREAYAPWLESRVIEIVHPEKIETF